MTKPDVLVFNPVYDAQVMARIDTAYKLHRLDKAEDKEQFLKEYGPRCKSVIINGHTEFNDSHLEALPNLKLIACSSAGYELMDIEVLQKRAISLTNTAEALFEDVADMAILLMMASKRNLVRGHDYVRAHLWSEKGMFALQSSLRGKNLGIAGFGNIGQAIAHKAAIFGLNISYHSRSEKAGLPYQYYEQLDALASWSDILIVVVPGGAETEHLIDQDILDKLGPSGVLVNVSRGSVVDEEALIAALKSGQLGHAALDVYKNEPTPNQQLISLEQVTLYPHHASGTVETRRRMSELVLENLDAFYAGTPLITPVY